jgi:membrane fusion protein (multidrug efflux system)
MAGFLGGGRRPVIIIALAVVVVAGSILAWVHFAGRESTDDAQVSGHVSPVATRVGGTVASIQVADNQAVKAGDVLVEIDSRDYQLAVAHAEADLAAAAASARAARTGVPITATTSKSQVDVAAAGTTSAEAAVKAAERDVDAARAKLRVAQARLAEATSTATRASHDLDRVKPLLAKDEISKQQYDAILALEESARAGVDSAQAAVIEAQANIDAADARRVQASSRLGEARSQANAASTAPEQIALTEARAAVADAQVVQAQSALDQAKLNLERTTVRAPSAGIVSRKSVEVGQVVQGGQPLLAIASLGDVWVTANFKETQLRDMRPGQRVEVSVDAYGGRTFTGKVESIAAATGATFSLLPPDNASGNFVKVVQRVPVKIILDQDNGQNPGAVLRPGMSVGATVFVK